MKMKNLKIVLTSALLLFNWIAYSQDRGSIINKSGFSVAVGLNQIKEENLHPKVHAGLLWNFSYARDKLKSKFSSFDINIGYSEVRTQLEDLNKTVNLNLLLQYGYTFKLFSSEKLRDFLGPQARLNYSLAFYPNWDESHLYWADYWSAGITNILVYNINPKQNIIARIEMPIVSLSSRPELNRQYKIDETSLTGVINNLHSNLQFGSVERVFYLTAGFEYQIVLSNRISEAIGYSFQYARVNASNGNPFQNINHGLVLKIYF